MFADVYRRRRVLITGHTGFKGSWLAMWLNELGAEVCGIGLPMPYAPSHFSLLRPRCRSEFVDINNYEGIRAIFADFAPEIVFHLAAQSLVRESYQHPVDTFATNVMGTVNVLECLRGTPSVRAAVIVSSDKCYENHGLGLSYTEGDSLGGYDPYSASKGCVEIVTAAYRRSYFNPDDFKRTHDMLIASARAGNVIGGGDWASDRIVPDLMKAAANDGVTSIRNPEAIRPWQHVMEPLSGYLTLGQHLLQGDKDAASAWNFGPDNNNVLTVVKIAELAKKIWPKISFTIAKNPGAPHEATTLRLNCDKAKQELRWHGVWDASEAVARAVTWYRDYYEQSKLNGEDDLHDYCHAATRQRLPWSF